MNKSNTIQQMRKLNELLQDYLDRMDMDEAEQKSKKDCKKEEK